jgi:adenylyl cyclase-associated protein
LVSKQPDAKVIQELVQPLVAEITAITAIKDKNRPSPLFSHLSMVADGVPALGWVVVSPTPAPYATEMKDAATFYANRVLKDKKDKDAIHGEWVQAFSSFLMDLVAYIKKWHTTGLAWNPKGGDAAGAASGLSLFVSWTAQRSAPASKAAGPLPPYVAQLEAMAIKETEKSGNFLGELSKGTTGLRKVDKSEMTHKNPELRATSVVPAAASKPGIVEKLISSGCCPCKRSCS